MNTASQSDWSTSEMSGEMEGGREGGRERERERGLPSPSFLRVHSPVSPGDVVQVNPPPEWNGDRASCCVIDGRNEGSVVVHPDTLISGTSVATSVTCVRRYM